MERPQATIITDEPIVAVIAEQKLLPDGLLEMARWIQRYRPQCVPEGGFQSVLDLLPHDGMDLVPGSSPPAKRKVTDNELLCEFAGRKCYDSFAEAGADRTNGEYLASMWTGRDVVHVSTGYHAKMTFFFAHVSRRVSHEFIRNYVGSDRNEEGSPSQESTRFTHHPGVYIAHPYYLNDVAELAYFRSRCNENYQEYIETIERKCRMYEHLHGKPPKGLDRKRIYESSAGDLLMSCGTSWIWTTNPMALAKFFKERCDDASDMEMSRFAKTVRKIAVNRWPNLFPGFAEFVGQP